MKYFNLDQYFFLPLLSCARKEVYLGSVQEMWMCGDFLPAPPPHPPLKCTFWIFSCSS